MSKFMKMLNNISRSQAIYRLSKVPAEDLTSGQYAFVLAIGRHPGCSQEELADELCVNKSTVTRNMNYLEENGYIVRRSLPQDKRQLAVFPTEKMLAVLPVIQTVSAEWMALLSEGIPSKDWDVFNTVLRQMEEKARKIIEEVNQ